eukprot:1835069-Rhodomonas_salina.1
MQPQEIEQIRNGGLDGLGIRSQKQCQLYFLLFVGAPCLLEGTPFLTKHRPEEIIMRMAKRDKKAH